MQKYEVIERLEELKDCEKIDFVTIEGYIRTANYSDIVNYTVSEFIEAPTSGIKILYCSIEQIIPHQTY